MSVIPLLAAPATPTALLALALAGIAGRAPHIDGLPPALSASELAAAVAAARATPDDTDAPLMLLGDALGLDDCNLLALALAAGVETDPGLCRLLAAVQAPIGGPRPLLGLLAISFAPPTATADAVLSLAEGPALRCGLLWLDATDLPLPERALAIHLPTLAALAGRAGDWSSVRLLSPDAAIPLPEDEVAAARRWAAALSARPDSVLLLRCHDQQEAQSAALVLAACLDRRVAWIEGSDPPSGLVPWLLAAQAIPIFAVRMKPGEQRALPRLALHRGPMLVAPGTEGSVETASAHVAEWSLHMPCPTARAGLWRGGGVADPAAERAGASFRQSPGRIAALTARAALVAEARGGAAPEWQDVRQAVACLGASGLDALAVRERPLDEVALIVPAALEETLAELLERCRRREDLADGLGPAIAMRQVRGVRALFHGPSGTGKSLAAHWLAARLGMPLYRADLAALTSKWIGETEKNLAGLLAAAEQADVVLLFDEADSLFAARTDIGDANDRFANAQTNYLLQRIETFAGLAVLTSNSRDRFDAAFTRRLDAIVEFPLPDAPARRALWQAHLGHAHSLEPSELDRLAVGCDLAGGHIRNVVLAAAARAGAAGRRIESTDLVRGASVEYSKLGRPPPPGWASP